MKTICVEENRLFVQPYKLLAASSLDCLQEQLGFTTICCGGGKGDHGHTHQIGPRILAVGKLPGSMVAAAGRGWRKFQGRCMTSRPLARSGAGASC